MSVRSGDDPLRDLLTARIWARLRQYEESRDRRHVLAPEARSEAFQLLRMVKEPLVETDTVYAVGMFLWTRARLLPGCEGKEDLETAVLALRVVHASRPDAVPAELAVHIREAEAGIDTSFRTEHDLGNRQLHRGLATGDVPALAEAVRRFTEALRLMPAGHEDRAGYLSDLGVALRNMYERTGDLRALESAIASLRESVAAAAVTDPARAMFLSNLGGALNNRFAVSRRREDLAESLALSRQAVSLRAPDDTEYAKRLSNLGGALLELSELDQEPATLDETLDVLQRAVDATLPSDLNRPRYLVNLAGALARRSRRTGDVADLDRAIGALQSVAGELPGNHPLRFGALVNLSDALRDRYLLTDSRLDLDAGVDAGRAALDAIAPGHPLHAVAEATLGLALCDRFNLSRNSADLDSAIALLRSAVRSLPDGGMRPGARTALGSALVIRAESSGSAADLDAAIQILEEAVEALPDGHSAREQAAGQLEKARARRQRYAENLRGADRWIDHWRTAEQTPPADDPLDPEKPKVLNDLGLSLFGRFRITGDAAVLDEAVEKVRAGVRATPAGAPRLTGALPGLDESLLRHREAAALAPDGAPVRGVVLLELGRALVLRYAYAEDTQALEETRAVLDGAARNPLLRPSARVTAAEELARCHAESGDWTAACAAYAYAIELLPAVAPRHEERRTQENGLSRFASLASDAAACALRLDDPDRALRLLEAGRGLLLAQALEIRTDVSELRRARPDLADRLAALRVRLDAPDTEFTAGPAGAAGAGAGSAAGATAGHVAGATAGPAAGVTTGPVAGVTTGPVVGPVVGPVAGGLGRRAAQERRRVAAEFDALLDDIRRLPGFETFLMPPTTAELCAQAQEGPVVVVNTSDFRCDALVLRPDRLQVVPLTGLTEADADARAESFARAVAAGRDHTRTAMQRKAAQDAVLETLGWLWDTVAEPVLDALGMAAEPAADQPWPRIWWSPSGVLSTLPLHAAGHHGQDAEAGRTVMDRAVSSYTPTIRALAHSRAWSPGSGRVLAVALPETPRATALAGALREMRLLASRYPYTLTLTGAEATGSRVLAELPHHSVAHSACHAVNDPADPSSGRLLVHDHLERPLRIRDIARLDLSGDLAYLSACETARSGPGFAAEAIHLTSAFQIAGYRHVIGTLWPVLDDAAAAIAVDVYGHLPQRSDGTPDTDRVALALHHALRRVRENYRAVPTRWASHLHVGR
ncbi:CHAT domain-containing protein [Streptomyces sp. NPDC048297]|uniref:CHAT domain-containing tetratricopeptide repeat protein n=1 Tax=Streptomyces sp. NPDC048297 TaxID=3365531 RepID=UPI003711C242